VLTKFTAGLACAALAATGAAQPVTLKYSAWRPAAYSMSAIGIGTWAKDVEAASQGNVKIEFPPNGIRANAIAPGAVETPMLGPLIANPHLHRDFLASIPLGRLGQPSDIAAMARFLISDEAERITSGLFVVDGELTDYLKSRIASFKVPREVFLVDALPKTPSGKVMKQKLRERL